MSKIRFREVDNRLLSDLWMAMSNMSDEIKEKLHLRYHLRLNPIYKQKTLDNFFKNKKKA